MGLECFIHLKVKIARTHTHTNKMHSTTVHKCAFWFGDRFLRAGIHPFVGRFIWINGTGMCRRCGLCLHSLITNNLSQVYMMYFCARSPPHTSRTHTHRYVNNLVRVHTTRTGMDTHTNAHLLACLHTWAALATASKLLIEVRSIRP